VVFDSKSSAAGPVELQLHGLARQLQVDHLVHFRGGLENADVSRALATIDLLVLPSRWDGWGAVINEALCNGAGSYAATLAVEPT